jgi:hypothetical protein
VELGLRRTTAIVIPFLLIALFTVQPTHAQGCGISVSPQPPIVNLPENSIPNNDGSSFAEIFNVNYTSNYSGQQLTLEYLKGSKWIGLYNFTGNQVGFTEVDRALDSNWASFGPNSIRVVSSSCSSEDVSFSIRTDQSAIVLDILLYAGLILSVFLFLKLGMRIGWGRFVIVAAAVYFAMSPFLGQRYDVYFLLSSGIRMLQHANPFDPGNPPIYPGQLKWAYPPLYPPYSALSFALYQGLTGSQLPTVSALTYPGWLTSTYSVYLAFAPSNLPVLVGLLKLPMVISAILTGTLLNRMTKKESMAIWWIANPLVILVAAVWGQIDPIATLFAVASLYAFEKRRPYHAYLFASLGAAIKVWPVLLIPLFFVVEMRKNHIETLKHLLAILPAFLLTGAIYALYGDPIQSMLVLINARGLPTFGGALSVNGLTWQELLSLIGSPPIPFFLLFGVPIFILILYHMYSSRDEDVLKWLVVSILVFYLTYNYVNPQYFYWIVPFLMLQRRRLATAAFSILPLVYMAVTYNIFYFVSPGLLRDEYVIGASIFEQMKLSFFYQSSTFLGVLAGAVPTVAYLYLLYRELKPPGILALGGGQPHHKTA